MQELLGSLLLILALALLIALFVARPFLEQLQSKAGAQRSGEEEKRDHQFSALLAERDRVLNALQELEFDFTLGKVPEEDYPVQRSALMQKGAGVLRQIDEMQPAVTVADSAEERIAAAVAARRADAAVKQSLASAVVVQEGASNNRQAAPAKDGLEDLIAARRRKRDEKTAGFCPHCGRPVLKSDKFCARCGATLS
jgi:hypothetical protein